MMASGPLSSLVESRHIYFFFLVFILSPVVQTAPASLSHGRTNDDKPWGRMARMLAEKWGDDQGTIQAYRDFKTVLTLHSIDEYMTEKVHRDPFYEPVRDKCFLQFEYCAEMASKGLCSDVSAATFMMEKCAPACGVCHLKSLETRCPFDWDDAKRFNALKAGYLNKVFERMVTDESFRQYGPITIHSMPAGSVHPVIIDGPWVVSFDNFLTEAECAKLRTYGETTGEGFKQSKARFLDPTRSDDFRTSNTNWCVSECHSDSDVQTIFDRIERLLSGIPKTNYEHLQILRYTEGQYYKTHHDYIPTKVNVPQGTRVLTVFLYLNNVEEGGGTNFPDLGGGDGLTVMPKMGKALVWPSVYDADPNEKDPRTRHMAQVVIKGVKYGANAWVHMRDYQTPLSQNFLCNPDIDINFSKLVN